MHDPFADAPDPVFAFTHDRTRPVESVSIKAFRRLFLLAGKGGMCLIVTAASVVSSLVATLLLQTLLGFEGRLFWMGIGVAIAVPSVIAPLISLQFSQLTEHLLGLEAQLQEQARRDALTGAPNRRWITERCDEAASFAAASGGSYGVMMIDVDHFKSINDRFGHHGGDQVLREVVRVLAARLRTTDRFGRYGGEEFLLLTNDQTPQGLEAAATALCRALADTPVRLGGIPVAITVSIGAAIATGRSGTGRADAVLRRADAALYRAKADGRNRVVVADGTHEDGEAPDQRTVATATPLGTHALTN